MSKSKLTAFTVLASLALPLLTTNPVMAEEIACTFAPAQTAPTSDPCTAVETDIDTLNFVNVAPHGDRGTEGRYSDQIIKILSSVNVIISRFK